VLITSERGREYNFGDSYSNGEIDFYPFDGPGVYRITVRLENVGEDGENRTVQFKDQLEVEQVPSDFLGSIQRAEGNFIYFVTDPSKRVFPGMQVTVTRFSPGTANTIASGNVTYQSGNEWTAELTSMDVIPDKGDLVLIK
jgi:hypothetical protein